VTSRNLIIVDDSRVSRMLITAIVKQSYPEWKIVEAGSGEEALELFTKAEIDFAILDYNMAGMNGLELAEKIKAQYSGTQVALLTANVQESTRRKSEELGVDFYEKPISDERVKSIFASYEASIHQNDAATHSDKVLALDELQHDVLVEIFNLGMGQAAASLSQLVEEEVQLNVPQVTFHSRTEAAARLDQQSGGRFSGVSQSFDGPFSGIAMLLFPEEKSLELVRLMLKSAVPLETLSDFEEEALNEIGNIILNAGLSSLADVLGTEVISSLPSIRRGDGKAVIRSDGQGDQQEQNNGKDIVLFLQVDFKLERHSLDGYVVYLLNMSSMNEFKRKIDDYIARLQGAMLKHAG